MNISTKKQHFGDISLNKALLTAFIVSGLIAVYLNLSAPGTLQLSNFYKTFMQLYQMYL